ncbi:MAG: molybdenum cofactor guanylyltransferase [Chloroflexi bacterium]|nr:molybdenum cofactor guanylyltransferase [Chloroflexota bacterium]
MAKSQAVTGVVLAGGRSRRLGRDKRLEPFAGQPLLSRVMARLAPVCDALVAVVADETMEDGLPLPAGATLVADRYPGKGSLGGIYTGLAAASTPWAFVVACDMPFLNASLIEHMLSLRRGHDVVVPILDGRPEPTHAAYAQACLPAIKHRLERDQLKIIGFFDDVRVRYVPEDELRRFDPDLLTFFNINTQADLDRALALAKAGC